MSRATSLVEGSLDHSLQELRDQIIMICRSGRAVQVGGLGTWSPNIALDCTFDLQYWADTALPKGMNEPKTLSGRLRNRKNIGKTGDELVVQWNVEHPDDPVTE